MPACKGTERSGRHLGGHAECINGRLADQWTASGRKAASRIAECFHNFRVLA